MVKGVNEKVDNYEDMATMFYYLLLFILILCIAKILSSRYTFFICEYICIGAIFQVRDPLAVIPLLIMVRPYLIAIT